MTCSDHAGWHGVPRAAPRAGFPVADKPARYGTEPIRVRTRQPQTGPGYPRPGSAHHAGGPDRAPVTVAPGPSLPRRATSALPRRSVLGRGVAEVKHAGLEGLRAQQLEGDARLVRRKQPGQAVADHDRVYEQVELVKKALAQQPAHGGGAAGHGDVATVLRLDTGQPPGHVAVDDP